MAHFPAHFYKDLCDKKFGEKPLAKALQNHDLLINDNWMANVWPELPPCARKVYLCTVICDHRKALFFETLSNEATLSLVKVDFASIFTESAIIKIFWPFLSEEQRSWWLDNGYSID